MDALLRELTERKSWETDKTFEDKQGFIAHLLQHEFAPRTFPNVQALMGEPDGETLISRVAALAQSYYNVKYLKCAYQEPVMAVLRSYPGFE